MKQFKKSIFRCWPWIAREIIYCPCRHRSWGWECAFGAEAEKARKKNGYFGAFSPITLRWTKKYFLFSFFSKPFLGFSRFNFTVGVYLKWIWSGRRSANVQRWRRHLKPFSGSVDWKIRWPFSQRIYIFHVAVFTFLFFFAVEFFSALSVVVHTNWSWTGSASIFRVCFFFGFLSFPSVGVFLEWTFSLLFRLSFFSLPVFWQFSCTMKKWKMDNFPRINALLICLFFKIFKGTSTTFTG